MTSGFMLDESAYHGLVYFTPCGQIDLPDVAEIGARIRHHLQSGTVGTVVVDLASVTLLDSRAVGMLVAGRQMADQAAAQYWVINAQGRVRDVLDVAGVLRYLDTRVAADDAG